MISGGYLNVIGIGSAGLQTRLTSGDTVVFRVRSQTAQDTWLVSIKGKQVKVRSEIPLSTGDVMKAKAHFERGQLFLKLMTQQKTSGAERFLQRQGMQVNNANIRLLESFMRSGLPLREELVSYAAKVLFSYPQSEQRKLGRFLAIMLDKGLRPSVEQSENLYTAVEGGGNPEEEGRSGGRERGGEQKGTGENRRRGTGKESQQEEQRLPGAEEIRRQWYRTAEQEDHGLQLWNHRVGERDNWLVVPLAWEHNGYRYEGRARVRITGGTADRFTLTVYARERWHFAADLSGTRRRMTLYTDSEKVIAQGRRVLEFLQENLHNKGFEIDDTIKREEEFDLFDPGTQAEMRGIDRIV